MARRRNGSASPGYTAQRAAVARWFEQASPEVPLESGPIPCQDRRRIQHRPPSRFTQHEPLHQIVRELCSDPRNHNHISKPESADRRIRPLGCASVSLPKKHSARTRSGIIPGFSGPKPAFRVPLFLNGLFSPCAAQRIYLSNQRRHGIGA